MPIGPSTVKFKKEENEARVIPYMRASVMGLATNAQMDNNVGEAQARPWSISIQYPDRKYAGCKWSKPDKGE